MKICALLFLSLLTACAVQAADADVPPTLMTRCGELLVDQAFEKPLPPFDGKSNGFASGFKGWRYNSAKRGGHWDVVDGTFRGVESVDPSIKHPATASYGFDFKDVVVSCEVRMHDVPVEGRGPRFVSVRTTDEKDYVCSLRIAEGDMRIEKSDNDHGGPDKPVPLGQIKTPFKMGEWHKVVIEILGEEMVATVDGHTLTGTHPLIATDKKSIMFVSGVENAVRGFKVWKALPNPGWAKHKAALKGAQ